jgi:hypothetical protein
VETSLQILALPNPEQELLKGRLTLQIYTILKDSNLKGVAQRRRTS